MVYFIKLEASVLQKADPPGPVLEVSDRIITEFALVRLLQQQLPAIIIPIQAGLGDTLIDTPFPEFGRDA